MLVGLAYDLRSDYLAEGFSDEETAEFDRPDTIDAIENELRDMGCQTDRIGHLRHMVGRLAGGDRWDLVFTIAEGMYGLAREAQVPALLDAYTIPYVFSDPLVMALTLHKGVTKRVVRDLGIPTADFAVVDRMDDVRRIDLPFPLFAKPVAEGTAKGINAKSKIRNRDELEQVCRRLLGDFKQPVLVETFLGGREFTVGIVGTGDAARCIGTLEVELLDGAEPDAYTYVNKERCEELVRYVLVDNELSRRSEEISLAVWRGLNCRDAGRVDVRADSNGEIHFLEVNPLAGLHPKHSDLPILCTQAGIPYRDLIRMIMESVVARHPGLNLPARRTASPTSMASAPAR
ncbi:MAG: D-alanine--D-alanine ligase [Phycisphaerales bacterium]|nr:D-alanine--D-alanine ligase [Phycisphaerales bacterium]